MVKAILKEIIITLLLCIAILLILSVVFYDYNPMNKIVPNKIAYSTPEDIKEEIGEQQVKDVLEGGLNVVYSINDSDLNKYKKSNSYVPGKENPFSETSVVVDENSNEGQTINANNTETNKNTSTTTKNPDSTGTFLNTTGKK